MLIYPQLQGAKALNIASKIFNKTIHKHDSHKSILSSTHSKNFITLHPIMGAGKGFLLHYLNGRG